MAKNDVDKLHEQKAERGGREGRGEKGKKERGGRKKKNKPVDSRRSREECVGVYTGVQNRGGKDGRDGAGEEGEGEK